jgi:hypothetical protein
MNPNNSYLTVKGTVLDLSTLDAEESSLVGRLRQDARALDDWNAFDNFGFNEVVTFYDARGLPRRTTCKSIPYLVCQDLSNRVAIKAGLARLPDYRDELEELIRSKFKTRKAFCDATDISESLLSHVIHRRKDLAIDTLEQALGKIGYQLRITRRAEPEMAGQR